MRALRDTDEMPFGEHKGKQMIDVPAEYLLWLYNNELRKGNVLNYIIDNMEALKKEVEESKPKKA